VDEVGLDVGFEHLEEIDSTEGHPTDIAQPPVLQGGGIQRCGAPSRQVEGLWIAVGLRHEVG
jgi:hypothetical protein